MKQKNFSIEEAVESAWQCFKKEPGFFLLILFVNYAFSFGWSLISSSLLVNGSTFLSISIQILLTILQIIMTIGFLKIAVKAVNGEKNDFFDLFAHYRFFWKYIFASILFGLCAGGLLLLTLILFALWIPLSAEFGISQTWMYSMNIFFGFLGFVGILMVFFFAIRFQFFGYCIVDKNAGIRESLRMSYQMTDGVFWKLVLLVIIFILFNGFGVVLFGVGLFLTVPITMLTTAFLYRRLSS